MSRGEFTESVPAHLDLDISATCVLPVALWVTGKSPCKQPCCARSRGHEILKSVYVVTAPQHCQLRGNPTTLLATVCLPDVLEF